MKKWLLFPVLAVSCLQAEVMDISRAVATAMEKNEEIQIANRDLENSKNTYTEAYSGALPVVSAQTTYLRNLYSSKIDQGAKSVNAVKDNTLSWQVDATQPLYIGGKVGTAIEIAEIYATLNQLSLDIKKDEIKAQVMKNFYNALMAREALKVTLLVQADAQKNLDRVEKLYQQGVASEFDLIKARVRFKEIKPKITELRHNVDIALNVLKISIGLDPKQDLDIKGEFNDQIALDTLNFYDRAIKNRKELKALNCQNQMYEKNVKIEFGDNLPSVFALGNYTFRSTNDDFAKTFDKNFGINSVSVGLTAKFPIFNGFSTTAKVDKAKVEVKKSGLQIEHTSRLIKLQAEQAFNKITEAKEEIVLQDETIKESERAVTIAETRYNNGIGTQLEFITSQTDLEQSRLKKIAAVNKYLQAVIDFKSAVGEL